MPPALREAVCSDRGLPTEIPEPFMAETTVLSAHQVDALSGTLTALLAEAQRNGSANVAVAEGQLELAPVGIPGEEELDEDEPEEPHDWDEAGEADEDQLPEA